MNAPELFPEVGAPKRTRTRALLFLLAVLALLAYVVPIALFLIERGEHHDAAADHTHQLALELKISVVDFARGNLTLQILPAGGTLIGSNGRLTREISMETDPGTGAIAHQFKPDTPLTPWVVHATTDSGDILDYPFDKYVVDLDFTAKSEGRPLTVSTALEHVPHGLKAHRSEREIAPGETEINIHVSRTPTIIFVAFLSTLSLFLVTAAACLVAWQVAFQDRKIEFSMMVWAAALLFVIPTVRNALPGSVPVGALIDYLIFFWLQIATAVAMSCLVVTWSRRSG